MSKFSKLKMSLKKERIILAFILILAAFLRFYKIGQVPPSLNWDEVAIGYNAYSILKTGRDEWGRRFPLLGFESFGEYKLPLFIYATIPGVWLFGLNELGVRFMPALFGVFSVWVTYLLGKELFKKKEIGLLAAFLMAVSAWDLQLTRAAFEAGLAQLLIALSILFLLKSSQKWFFLPLSVLLASLSVYTYNSSRVFIPLFFGGLFLLRPSFFLKNIKGLLWSGLIILIFAVPLIFYMKTPVVQGRYQLISIPADPGFVLRINRARGKLLSSGWPPFLSRAVHNKITHYVHDFLKYYLSHFSPNFLFLKGAEHTQHSVPGFGQFLVIWSFPMLIGFGVLIKRLWKKKPYFPAYVLFLQILAAPVGSSMTINGNPHALRSLCSLPAWQIIIALGLWEGAKILKRHVSKKRVYKLIIAFFFLGFLVNFLIFEHKYYTIYPREYASDWQYGYKEAARFVWANKNDYDKIFFTRDYGEPYIFFLFYTHYPPDQYQRVKKKRVRRYNWVWVDMIGDRFYFPDFTDPGDSVLDIAQREKGRLLFVGSPGDIPEKWIIKKIYFPNGKIAFEIGSSAD